MEIVGAIILIMLIGLDVMVFFKLFKFLNQNFNMPEFLDVFLSSLGASLAVMAFVEMSVWIYKNDYYVHDFFNAMGSL